MAERHPQKIRFTSKSLVIGTRSSKRSTKPREIYSKKPPGKIRTDFVTDSLYFTCAYRSMLFCRQLQQPVFFKKYPKMGTRFSRNLQKIRWTRPPSQLFPGIFSVFDCRSRLYPELHHAVSSTFFVVIQLVIFFGKRFVVTSFNQIATAVDIYVEILVELQHRLE